MAMDPELKAILEVLVAGQERVEAAAAQNTKTLKTLEVGQARMLSRIASLETLAIRLEGKVDVLDARMDALNDQLKAQNDDSDDSQAA